MKLAIFTLAIGEKFKALSEVTHPTIEAYAKKCGASFFVVDEATEFARKYVEMGKPHWAKLAGMRYFLERFDRVLYVDTDILIRDDSPNLFDVVGDELAAFKESQFVDRHASFMEYLRFVGYPKIAEWKGDYYNTGVLLANKSHKSVFAEPPIYEDHFYEQSYINVQIEFLRPKVHNLHYKFNRMSCMDAITGEVRHDSYFLHYAGMSAIEGINLPELMTKDMIAWSVERNFKKNIAIMVEGGLGDQIAAEPTVRYVIQKIYPTDNVIVCTDWPEIFEHLPVKAYRPNEPVENHLSYHKLHTMRTPQHDSWKWMSHPLVHCVDFASLQAIRLQLPLSYKQPQLPLADIEMPFVTENTVLVHPGKGWFTKTFPVDVWQSYIDALVDAGKDVVVIGKRINDEQGVVEVDTSRCLDLIDKLSLKELIATINKAPVLISNDSSPVHIAGAFDNWIGLIATCKAPDYILHNRNGSIWYKARSLERDGLYLDFSTQPTQIYGVSIDQCTEERLRECLPSAEEVVRFVKEIDHANRF